MTTVAALDVHRSAIQLADGRELFYFDDSAQPGRDAVDQRDLPPVSTSSEIRYDPLLDQWVVIASHRQGRIQMPSLAECPLCPSTEDRHTEVPASDYQVVVFENRFPSLAQSVTSVLDDGGDTGLVVRRPGVGRCEVVCFTSDHNTSFVGLGPDRVRLVLEAWADRTAAISVMPGVEHVFVFENRGTEIGVTLPHPHGQVYGYPFVPPRTKRMLVSAASHQAQTGENLFERIVSDEIESGMRIVARSEHWVAFVPRAARWPFEVHVYPRRRVPDIVALDGEQRADFAPLYLDVLRRFDALFGVTMPYIAAWHQAPVRSNRDLAACFLQIFSIRRGEGKLKYLAGSESGAGVWINDILPERAAEMLRGAGADR